LASASTHSPASTALFPERPVILFEYYWERPEQKADWNNGVYLLGDNYSQFVRASIPEPSVTASILGAAVLAGAVVVRRSRKDAGKSEPV